MMFDNKYKTEGSKLYTTLLKRYVSHEATMRPDLPASHSSKYLDLKFIVDKFTSNMNTDCVTRLLSFEKTSLELSRHGLQTHSDTPISTEISHIKQTVESLSNSMAVLTQYVLQIDHRSIRAQTQNDT